MLRKSVAYKLDGSKRLYRRHVKVSQTVKEIEEPIVPLLGLAAQNYCA
jgi:hypothetical protein